MAQATASLFGREALKVAAQYVNKAFEDGRNNRGPLVDQFQMADDLNGVGYAWCASFVAFTAEKVYGKDFPVVGEAGVRSWVTWGRKNGYIATRPYAGDLVAYRFKSADTTDHIGWVEKVLALGPYLRIQTIEGNTGPSGAVSDPGTGRDGVYRKVRYVRASSVTFIRIPDEFLAATRITPPKPAPAPAPKPAPKATHEVLINGKVVARVAGHPKIEIRHI